MAKITAPAIPMKMYRHFAVITILLTAVMAIFVQGEERNAIVAAAEAQSEESWARMQQKKQSKPPELIVSAEPSANKDLDSFYSQGSVNSGKASALSGGQAQYVKDRPIWVMFQMTQKEWEQLTDEEKAKLLASLDRQPSYTEPSESDEPGREETNIDALVAASRARARGEV